VYAKTYGFARLDTKEAITLDTEFDIASVSKQFTAMAIMILAERGKLSLDDPITKFFPEFPAYAQKIKIRNLLTHTSGLVDEINPRWFKAGYEPTSRDVLKMMTAESTVNFAPGEKFEYNNAGYLLLALLVEKVAGESFPKFMRKNVFSPLSMDHTRIWDETKPKIEHLAISYEPEGNSFKPVAYVSDVSLYGPKGVITTLQDLAKWIESLETEKLVRAATLRQAFVPVKLNDGTESPYGFGWALVKENGLAMTEHAGGYLGYRAEIRRSPDERTTVILLSNNATFDMVRFAKKIAVIYLADKMVAPTAIKVDAAILNSYVGKYEGDPSVTANLIIEITMENGELYITSALKPKTKLVAHSLTGFLISETTASVSFNRDAQGTVTGLIVKTKRAIINARRLDN
jgi:CubicO group peptidase (beta-lactamase class C family)